MCWSNSSQTLSRLGLLWGLLSLATLLAAFVSNVWLYTKEPIHLPNSDISTTVTFKIGLWRVCPTYKRTNTTHYMPSPSCSLIKYSSWDDITASDIGIGAPLEFTPAFLTRMRFSTPFEAVSVALILIATIFAVVGHCRNDHRTLVACGLYMLGGLTLGGGLVIFASVLSDAYFERPRRQHVINDVMEKMTSSSSFDYKYGWSFIAAGGAFIMSELAAVLSISAYLRRFPTVEDMVRVMVPGAERRLREHQGLAGEYLVQHQHKYQRHKTDGSASLSSGLNTRCYSKSDVLISSDLEGVEGPLLLSKTAPDICTSNPAILTDDVIDFTGPAATSSNIITGHGGGYALKSEPTFILDESNGILTDNIQIKPTNVSLAGQTVPIVLMHHSHRPAAMSASTIPKAAAAPFIFVEQSNEMTRNYNTNTLPHREKFHPGAIRPEVRFGTGTLPPKQFRGVATLDDSTFTDQLHKKFSDIHEFEGHLTLNQRFGSALSHLSSGLDSGTGTLVGTFNNDGSLIHTGVLGVSSDIPGTSSTTSSSSGGTGTTTGSCHSNTSSKSFQPASHKKKTVTIGSVFSTMDTFESNKTNDDLFGGASAV